MILLLGGTVETGALLQALCLPEGGALPQQVLLCTATAEELSISPAVWKSGFARRRCGRLDQAGLIRLLREEPIRLAVCAVHPYAEAARDNLLAAAQECGIPVLVYLRPGSAEYSQSVAAPASPPSREQTAAQTTPAAAPANTQSTDGVVLTAATHTEAAGLAVRIARERSAGILLTTGSRHLQEYAQAAALTKTPLYARVLDCPESRSALEAAGIPADHAIFGKGPFSAEENVRQIQRCTAAVLVSKESGNAGGVREKLQAARTTGCAVVIVARPKVTCPVQTSLPDLIAAIRNTYQSLPADRPKIQAATGAIQQKPATQRRSCVLLGAGCAAAVGAGLIFMFLICTGLFWKLHLPKSEEALRQDNIAYLRGTLGEIVLECRAKTGHFPASIEEALVALDRRLAHRGDKYGSGLSYRRVSERELFFHSSGWDEKTNTADDIILLFYDGNWYIGDWGYLTESEDRELNNIGTNKPLPPPSRLAHFLKLPPPKQ